MFEFEKGIFPPPSWEGKIVQKLLSRHILIYLFDLRNIFINEKLNSLSDILLFGFMGKMSHNGQQWRVFTPPPK